MSKRQDACRRPPIVGALLKVPLTLAGSSVLRVCANRFARDTCSRAVYFVGYTSFCAYFFHRIVFKYTTALYFPG